MLVSEITQITANDVIKDLLLHNRPQPALAHCLNQSVIRCHRNSLRPQLGIPITYK